MLQRLKNFLISVITSPNCNGLLFFNVTRS